MNLAAKDSSEILRVSRAHGATDIRVFGSRARGDARPESDLDLLVTLEEGRSLLDLVAIKQELEDSLGWRVDVLTPGAMSPYLRSRIMAEAIALD